MTYPILSWALPIALSMLVLAMVLALVRLVGMSRHLPRS